MIAENIYGRCRHNFFAFLSQETSKKHPILYLQTNLLGVDMLNLLDGGAKSSFAKSSFAPPAPQIGHNWLPSTYLPQPSQNTIKPRPY